MIARAVSASRYVFAYFTIHLISLQFTVFGLHAYFSVYVLKQWSYSDYALYKALKKLVSEGKCLCQGF